jgi:peptidoglycan/xylan/chitin deacetylase (PgdA/CDA1 family)
LRSRYLFAAGAAGHALPALAPVVPGVAAALRIPTGLGTAEGVALTFDDGPHPEGTAAALEILRDAGVPATFFLAGEQVERYPALAAEIAAAGHEIGLHCQRHRNQLRLPPWQIVDDMRRGEAAIVAADLPAPRLFRPPYGIFSASGLLLARRRYRLLLWTRWGRDWSARSTAAAIAQKATEKPGDVILLHDADHYSDRGSWRATIAALPMILDTLADRNQPVIAVP